MDNATILEKRIHNLVACEQALKLNWEPASMTNEFEYLRLKSWREILIGQMRAIIYMFPLSSIYVNCWSTMHKKHITDQIGLGRLISKHEMFCFEKTVFKTFELLLEYLIFRKTV
jgi:hypothetical protein